MKGKPEIAAEQVARSIDRRGALRRSAQWLFGTATAVAVTGRLGGEAAGHTLNGQAHCRYTSSATSCEPPNGKFCSGCSGHACPPNFHWSSSYGWPSACWCTRQSLTSYKICCDCQRRASPSSADCGCFSTVRVSRVAETLGLP
jgi:hypothetical protein